VLRYRARVTGLDAKLPAGSYAAACWLGLQDTIPRAAVVGLHARVEATKPDAWEDPSVVQVWFRGADYVVPRADVGVFTLGASPRDPDRMRDLERVTDEVHRVADGETLLVREVERRLSDRRPFIVRSTAMTGRVHIRWNASNIWLIPVGRPSIEPEAARRELALRFVHGFAPVSSDGLARWTGWTAGDARTTWRTIENRLVGVEVDGLDSKPARFALESDLDALRSAEPLSGVRLISIDDPLTKLDPSLVVPDPEVRRRVLPTPSQSPGYAVNVLLVDGEVAGGWQRQQRRVTIHPLGRLSKADRRAAEAEALAMPIAGGKPPSVSWDQRL
jgi:hypothetical protein